MSSAINIVAEEDLEGLCNRMGAEINVDPRKQRREEIRAPMHVADRVNAQTGGDARSRHFSRRC